MILDEKIIISSLNKTFIASKGEKMPSYPTKKNNEHSLQGGTLPLRYFSKNLK